jgi:hypothetical protein
VREPTSSEIDTALVRLKTGVERYIWLQRNVRVCDVTQNKEFQTRFDAFYKVRRGPIWRAEYFSLMEAAKGSGIDFPDALREFRHRTCQVEVAFASKLVATLDPTRPVIDRFVLQNFNLQLPTWGAREREARAVDVYRGLCSGYAALLQSKAGAVILDRFESRFPGSGITELKKIDLVLWQIR